MHYGIEKGAIAPHMAGKTIAEVIGGGGGGGLLPFRSHHALRESALC